MLSIVQLHNLPVSDQLGLIRPVDRGQVRLEVLLVLGQLDHLPWWQRFSSFVSEEKALPALLYWSISKDQLVQIDQSLCYQSLYFRNKPQPFTLIQSYLYLVPSPPPQNGSPDVTS